MAFAVIDTIYYWYSSENGTDTVHRRLDESWNSALRYGEVERFVDWMGSNTRYSPLWQHQRWPDGHLVCILPTVLDAARTTTRLRDVPSPAAENVRSALYTALPRGRIKRCTRPSVCPYVPCIQFSRNRKAV